MEYLRITVNQATILRKIEDNIDKIPEYDVELIVKKSKTESQNNAYNSFINLLAQESGLLPSEFKVTMKYELGLFEEVDMKGKLITMFKSSSDFIKSEWEAVFLYLQQIADFLGCTLPPFKQTKKINIKLNNND